MQHGHNPTFAQVSVPYCGGGTKANLRRSPSRDEARGVEVEGITRWIEGGIGKASSLRVPGGRLSGI